MGSYETLKSWMPGYYDGVAEMEAILSVEGDLLDEAIENIEQLNKNCYLTRCDMGTIIALEKAVKIKQNQSRTDTDRRNLVMSYFIGFGKMSGSKIKTIVKAFGLNASVALKPYNEAGDEALVVTIRSSSNPVSLADVDAVLRTRVPAHLAIEYQFLYRTWQGVLELGTWENVKTFTWDSLLIVDNEEMYKLYVDSDAVYYRKNGKGNAYVVYVDGAPYARKVEDV